MGTVLVDQVAANGDVLQDVDTTLSGRARTELLLAALPGSTPAEYAGVQAVRFEDQVILSKQVTYLGRPWEPYKKRIQIPGTWLQVAPRAALDRLRVRFVGIYHWRSTTVFVDFEPSTYLTRKANNSSAHVATNDLYQAQTLGQFSREDQGGNRLTSVRGDHFANYLRRGLRQRRGHIEVIDRFAVSLLDGSHVEGLAAVKEMHAAQWPDAFQGEWAGFYLEHRLSAFLREHRLGDQLVVQKEKRRGGLDFDLRFLDNGELQHYGDLKASNVAVDVAPGNDASDFYECLAATGRFWYVIFEHQTWHSRDNGNLATMAWNQWRRSAGHMGRRGEFDPLSYAGKYKEAVRLVEAKVLEVNQANAAIALGEFQSGFKQYDGTTPRAGKVLIKKRDIDNFLIYRKRLP